MMREAEAKVLRFMIRECPYYQRDFTKMEHKYVPYYHIPSGAWAIQSVKQAINAPILWHWPKEAWTKAIQQIPRDILLMMGVFHGE